MIHSDRPIHVHSFPSVSFWLSLPSFPFQLTCFTRALPRHFSSRLDDNGCSAYTEKNVPLLDQQVVRQGIAEQINPLQATAATPQLPSLHLLHTQLVFLLVLAPTSPQQPQHHVATLILAGPIPSRDRAALRSVSQGKCLCAMCSVMSSRSTTSSTLAVTRSAPLPPTVPQLTRSHHCSRHRRR